VFFRGNLEKMEKRLKLVDVIAKPGRAKHLCRRREPPDSDFVVSKSPEGGT
jgi:hypothetical protein